MKHVVSQCVLVRYYVGYNLVVETPLDRGVMTNVSLKCQSFWSSQVGKYAIVSE